MRSVTQTPSEGEYVCALVWWAGLSYRDAYCEEVGSEGVRRGGDGGMGYKQ